MEVVSVAAAVVSVLNLRKILAKLIAIPGEMTFKLL